MAKRYQFTEEGNGSIQIDYPVITKPTDGSGSNGFSVCNNIEELQKGYENAKKESPSGNVIVEEFVKNDSIVVFYTFSNGQMFFSGLKRSSPFVMKIKGGMLRVLMCLKAVLHRSFEESSIQNLKRCSAA